MMNFLELLAKESMLLMLILALHLRKKNYISIVNVPRIPVNR